jgi:hypothetical protein
MIDATLVQRVDDARAPLGQTRRVYVERALEAALGGSSGHEAGAAKRSPAPPRTPVGKLIDTATGAETPVAQGATVTLADIGIELPRCESCERRGPPRSFPCKTCGHQRAAK